MSVLAEAVAALAADEARALVAAAAALAGGQSQDGDGAGGVLASIERAAQASGARIGLAAIAGVLEWAGAQEGGSAACPRCGRGARLVGRRPRRIRTLLGTVTMTRSYHHCRTCQGGFAPWDTRAGIVGGSLSPGLARAAALAGAEMPYAKSFDLIGTVVKRRIGCGRGWGVTTSRVRVASGGSWWTVASMVGVKSVRMR